MDEKSCYPSPESAMPSDIVRWTRDLRPAHYTLKIESFTFLLQFLEKIGAKCYDTQIFEACGYKWKLSLYPNGDKERNGTDHISLYLVVEETSALPLGWEINASFKFFVFDQIRDEYIVVQDGAGKVRRFHEMKKEWGISQLLPLSTFEDASRGFLDQDKCAFGVEIFVNTCTGRGECLALPVDLSSSNTYTWKVNNYSTLSEESCYSPVFTLGNCKWKVVFYPKGNKQQHGKYLSVYLASDDLETTARVFAEFKLRIKNEKNHKHEEYSAKHWFNTSSPDWGWPSFISVDDVQNASNGYLVRDTLDIEAEITRISTVKCFS